MPQTSNMNVAEHINPIMLTVKGKSVFLSSGHMLINYFVTSPCLRAFKDGRGVEDEGLRNFSKDSDHC